MIYKIGKWLIYSLAVGKSNISGEDWGDIFGKAIKGNHLSSPVGSADIILDKEAWSLKSIQHNNPHTCEHIRVISGRNSPDYSYGITDPREDIQKTGEAVLGIWWVYGTRGLMLHLINLTI